MRRNSEIKTIRRIQEKPRISLALFAAGTALCLAGCNCEKKPKIEGEKAVAVKIPDGKGGEIKAKPKVPVGCNAKGKKMENVRKKRLKEGKTVVVSMSENEIGGSFKIEKITKQGVIFHVCIPSKGVDGMLLVGKGRKRNIEGINIEVHNTNRKKKTVYLSITPVTIMADANGTGKKTKE